MITSTAQLGLQQIPRINQPETFEPEIWLPVLLHQAQSSVLQTVWLGEKTMGIVVYTKSLFSFCPIWSYLYIWRNSFESVSAFAAD